MVQINPAQALTYSFSATTANGLTVGSLQFNTSSGTNVTPVLSGISLTSWRGFAVNTTASSFGSTNSAGAPTFDITPTTVAINTDGGITFNPINPGFGIVSA